MPAAPPKDPDRNGSPRLLVVEDETVQRLVVAAVARNAGFVADVAATLARGEALLGQARYGVVVLDLSLDDRDGIELLRTIHNTGSDPILILISAFDERIRQAVARMAASLGLRVAGTLAKPVRLDELTRLLRSIPDRPRTQQDHEAADLDPAELAGAIERDEIRCLYQPKVRLDDRRIVGLEVLTRWHSRAHGLVVPDLFIPLAERSGLIDRLTWHILARSLADFRPWRAQHPDLTLAVNLSPVSLTELGLPEQVSAVLADSATPPQSLVLEVTEGAVMADQVAAADILTRLRIRGVRISIDDFGTGYSSLLSLLRLPFNEIKIDQSFVRLLRHDPEAAKIIRAVVMLARELDVELVGEGIESDAEAARLAALGCPVGQGFLFAPPLSAAAMSARLAPAMAAAA